MDTLTRDTARPPKQQYHRLSEVRQGAVIDVYDRRWVRDGIQVAYFIRGQAHTDVNYSHWIVPGTLDAADFS